jgi:hypothetical protein
VLTAADFERMLALRFDLGERPCAESREHLPVRDQADRRGVNQHPVETGGALLQQLPMRGELRPASGIGPGCPAVIRLSRFRIWTRAGSRWWSGSASLRPQTFSSPNTSWNAGQRYYAYYGAGYGEERGTPGAG